MMAKICSERAPSHRTVCLSAETVRTNRHCQSAPWLVAISPWCFLGSADWGSWSPIMKDTERGEKKTGSRKETSMHTCSHTHARRGRYQGCCFTEAPRCFYPCPRGNLPNTGCHTFGNSSIALPCFIIYNKSGGQSFLLDLFSHAGGQANVVFSN